MVDLTVRGAGIFGLSIAWACVQRGARVRIVDPFGAGSGSSGGVVGALAPHVPENWNPKKAFQLDSLLMANAFWANVHSASGVNPGYVRSGRIQPISDAAALELARAREEPSQDLWGDHARWQVLKADASQGWSPHSPSGWVIHDTLSALLHPRQAVDALVVALETKGVMVATDARDEGQVLWATGIAGLEALNAQHPRSVGGGVKGQAAVFDYDARGSAQLFVDGLHIIPHLDGTVAVGSTSERDYSAPDTTDGLLDQVIARARDALPLLREAQVVNRWAAVRPRARSRAPMLGAWPDRTGHYIANGGFKIGFGMAPKIADVMADLILEGRDNIPSGFEVAASL